MKALAKSPISEDQAFECTYLKAPHFDPNWHFHSEYQLFLVLRGTGTRFVGDHVQAFGPGDLVLTGPNLPHLWRSDPEYFEGDEARWTEGLVIYFPKDFFSSQFLQKVETFQIRSMLDVASRGLAFTGSTASKVKLMIEAQAKKTGFEGVIGLLEILNVLATSTESTVLANPGYFNSLKEADTERMNRVHAYVMKHFREKITLSEVAALANMTPSSFSRYFRVHANKTFSEFVTGIRIGYSCKLILEKKASITQACYESGFNTVSNFNRQFKAATNYSPVEYRNVVMGSSRLKV